MKEFVLTNMLLFLMNSLQSYHYCHISPMHPPTKKSNIGSCLAEDWGITSYIVKVLNF